MDTNKSKITGGTFMSIKKGTMPPRYDEAFKSGAIKMVTEHGRPSKDVAAELGICVETLKSWLKHAGRGSLSSKPRNKCAGLRKLTKYSDSFHFLKLFVSIFHGRAQF